MNPLLPAIFTGLAAALVARLMIRPRRPLAGRVLPYTIPSRAALGSGLKSLDASPQTGLPGTIVQRLFGPLVESLARALGRVLQSEGEQRLLRRLRQADLLQDVPEGQRAQQYRIRQLGAAGVGILSGGSLGVVLARSPSASLGLGVLGFIVGVTRWRARLDRSIEERQERARIELYTINQILAMRTRAGGGVVQAIQHVVNQGSGVVASELRDALRLHRGGLSASDAFLRIAELTAEPFAARTYRLLATAEDRGTDLGTALLALSDDVREARRDTLRRQATRRRAAMLIPIIGLMAPVMLLFIVAPITDLVFGIGG